MKTALALFLLIGGLPLLAIDDVTILPTRKTLDKNSAREGGNTSTEEKQIIYNVKVTSRSFRDLQNVTVKYIIFYEDEQFGSTAESEIRSVTGSHAIPALQNNRPVEFETDPVKLERQQLDGNWYFRGGGNRNARDKVVGLWFKAFDPEGKQIGEYVNPSSVKTKQKWKE